MKELTVACTCPESEQELLEFVQALAQFSVSFHGFAVRLLLVDNLGVSQAYSNEVQSALSALPFGVKVEVILGVNQFHALFEAAFSVRSDVVVTMDPDMADNIKDLPLFYKKIEEGKQLVFSVRKQREDVGAFRSLGSQFFNGLLRRVFNVPVRDVNTPMIMFCSSLSSMFQEFPEAAGHPKFYYPYVLGDKFCELPIVVHSKPKRSSYSWTLLFLLGLQQLKQAYQFSRFIRKH